MISLASVSFRYDNILNLSATLNEYKIGWWLGLPATSGSKYFYNLFDINHGTLTGFANSSSGWWGSTRPGGYVGLKLNGDGDYVSVDDSTKFQFTNTNFSVSCWFMLETLNNPNSNGRQTVVSRYESANSKGFSIDIDTTGSIIFRVAESAVLFGEYASAGSTISIDTWYHCLVVRQGIASFVYLNGRLVASGTSASTLNISSGSQNVLFGDMVTNGGGRQYLKGYIDDVCIYNTSLTSYLGQRIFNESRTDYPTTLNKIYVNRAFSIAAPWLYFNMLQNAYGVTL